MSTLDTQDLSVGRWTVLSEGPNASDGGIQWYCRCECGTERLVAARSIRSGRSSSCGCRRSEIAKDLIKELHNKNRRHGLSGTPVYAVWVAMKQRCFNPDNDSYFRYGARGITVCERWRNSFEAFLEDVGLPSEPGLQLDRVDNNGNYEPGNVRWATRAQQHANRGEYHCKCCRQRQVEEMLILGRMFRSEPGAQS